MDKERDKKAGIFLNSTEVSFTLSIRDQGSEQDENKAEKCRQHFYDRFSTASEKRLGSVTFHHEVLQRGSMLV